MFFFQAGRTVGLASLLFFGSTFNNPIGVALQQQPLPFSEITKVEGENEKRKRTSIPICVLQ
jgi:hypothetical protein